MWVPPEVKEPVLLHAPTRKSVGYFGAVRLRDGKFIYAREEDKFNGQSYWQFLKQLAREVFGAVNEWSPLSTTRSIITRSCIRLGERRLCPGYAPV
jgi:hypothetical protein